jgi:hypothetical protein
VRDRVQHHGRRIGLACSQGQSANTLKIHAPPAVLRFRNGEIFCSPETVSGLPSSLPSNEVKKVKRRQIGLNQYARFLMTSVGWLLGNINQLHQNSLTFEFVGKRHMTPRRGISL